ncbi:MAG: DUF1080 domain-containing protein [bacterium]|nr:DUF1080 domain-containing protein [bacterium]
MIQRTAFAAFLLCLIVLAPAAQSTDDGWISLFDGKTLNGWKAGENPGSIRVENDAILCSGPRAHLFYTGEVNGASFKNFILKTDVLTRPLANSGVYFHTQFQESGWPGQGYEVQVNNTHHGEGGYYEYKKTGSLYGVRNQYFSMAHDDEWFTMTIRVAGKHVQVWVNDAMTVDYVEPENPPRSGDGVGRRLGRGTFALQGHDPASVAYFKNIMVKPLPDDLTDGVEAPVVDDVYLKIARLHESNFPVMDLHTHLKGGLTLEEALANSRRVGINYGIALNCGLGFPVDSNEKVTDFLNQMKGQPALIAMQGEGREWVNLFTKESREQFDYVFSDALTWTDDKGRRTRLWMPDEVWVDDKQAFMDMYVDRIVGILRDEPIDIFVNPTFLPDVIASEYDALWTDTRMQRVIDAAKASGVAIEINNRYRIPSAAFIKKAKAAGVKFTFGTNNGDRELGRMEYALDMIDKCKLTADDLWVPVKKTR